jgi:predicted tellurium resistance membrane protein TerC
MADLLTTENLIALLTLSLLEIVLGIDNLVILSILTGRLPADQRPRTRRLGLFLAMIMRIALLCGLAWILRLTEPLFTALGRPVSGRDLILLAGGLFLIAKATWEIHDKLEGAERAAGAGRAAASFGAVIVQIVLLDAVFSLDSVITAIGMARHLAVMIAAIVLAVGAMMACAGAVGDFVERHPTIKMLALSFLILIGVLLVAEGLGRHIERGYVYFAMAFSLGVELLNMRLRKVAPPVQLRHTTLAGKEEGGG